MELHNVSLSMKGFYFRLLPFFHPTPQLGTLIKASHLTPAWPCSPAAMFPLPTWWINDPQIAMFPLPPWPISSNLTPLPCSVRDKEEDMCRYRVDQGEMEHEQWMVLCVCKQGRWRHASDERYSGPLVNDTDHKGGDRMGAQGQYCEP